MNTTVFTTFLAFLEKLDTQHISYTLAHNREEALTVCVAVPGERWEIEFLGDGSVEVEKFCSTGEIQDAQSLSELFARYTDQEDQSKSDGEQQLANIVDKVA
jgi:hypothetical protein